MTTDLKAIAAAFRAAKPLLWDGHHPRKLGSRYICFALDGSLHPAANAAKAIVLKRVRPAYSFDGWLALQFIPDLVIGDARIQAHRHAWLDMLIAEFEGEEK